MRLNNAFTVLIYFNFALSFVLLLETFYFFFDFVIELFPNFRNVITNQALFVGVKSCFNGFVTLFGEKVFIGGDPNFLHFGVEDG